MLCEMQSFSSRIWTRVAAPISFDDNHYTTGTSKQITNSILTKTKNVAQSAAAVEYTDCISAEG